MYQLGNRHLPRNVRCVFCIFSVSSSRYTQPNVFSTLSEGNAISSYSTIGTVLYGVLLWFFKMKETFTLCMASNVSLAAMIMTSSPENVIGTTTMFPNIRCIFVQKWQSLKTRPAAKPKPCRDEVYVYALRIDFMAFNITCNCTVGTLQIQNDFRTDSEKHCEKSRHL